MEGFHAAFSVLPQNTIAREVALGFCEIMCARNSDPYVFVFDPVEILAAPAKIKGLTTGGTEAHRKNRQFRIGTRARAPAPLLCLWCVSD